MIVYLSSSCWLCFLPKCDSRKWSFNLAEMIIFSGFLCCGILSFSFSICNSISKWILGNEADLTFYSHNWKFTSSCKLRTSCISVQPSRVPHCDSRDCSMPGLPVHHQLPEFTQTHVRWVSDAIQPSHPLSSPSPAVSLSQHQSFPVSQFFASGGQGIGVSASTSVLPTSIQDWFPLGWTGWISLQSKWFSRVFSNTTVQKHHFFDTQLSLQPNSHIHAWLLEKP